MALHLSKMSNLPLSKEQLENFILHHIHAWAEDHVHSNPDQKLALTQEMDTLFGMFFIELADKLRKEVLPKFEEAV